MPVQRLKHPHPIKFIRACALEAIDRSGPSATAENEDSILKVLRWHDRRDWAEVISQHRDVNPHWFEQ
jgi:hypothetical protein